jgi:predicted dehydrogenase
MDDIRFGIVGLGSIGGRHAAVVEGTDRAVVAAGCDIDATRMKPFQERHPQAPFYTNFTDFLDKAPVDVVSICTPHGLHATMAIEAARHGKHILVEKPMALTVHEAEAMIRVAQEAGVHLMVVKQNRYNTPIALVKKALEDNRLGKVFMVQCNVLWNRSQEYYNESNWRGKRMLEGGVLHTQVSHFIDLMIWWFGEIHDVRARVSTKNHQIEIEDCGVAELEFDSGVMGSLTWTTCVYNKNYEGSLTIVGEKGMVKIGGQYLNKIEFWDVQSYPMPDGLKFEDKPNAYGGKYQGSSSNHDQVMGDVVAELLGERHNVVEGDEGIKTIKAIERIYAAARKSP